MNHRTIVRCSWLLAALSLAGSARAEEAEVSASVQPASGSESVVPHVEAGLFGGSLPPSREGAHERFKRTRDAERFLSEHPNTRTAGPFVLGEQGAGAIPVYPFPKRAAEAFALMAKGSPR